MSQEIIKAVDQSPLFALLTDYVMSAPGMLGRAAGACASGMANAATFIGAAVSDGVGGITNRLGDIVQSPPAVGLEQARAPEMAPTRAMGQFDVAIDEIGSLPAPTFSAPPIQQQTGIGV